MKIYIYIVLFLIIIWFFVNWRYFITSRKPHSGHIKKIMIGLPTIDRDSKIKKEFWERLQLSIKNSSEYDFEIVPIMRKSDHSMINFWKEKGSIVILDHYPIIKRHNMEKLSEIFNIIKEKGKNYDALIIIESDIMVEADTLSKLIDALSFSHVALFPFVTPWAGYPYIIDNDWLYKSLDLEKFNGKGKYIIGHGTGCVIMNKEVLMDDNITFDIMSFGSVTGQDVGFFRNLHTNYYKVYMINEELEHLHRTSLRSKNKFAIK